MPALSIDEQLNILADNRHEIQTTGTCYNDEFTSWHARYHHLIMNTKVYGRRVCINLLYSRVEHMHHFTVRYDKPYLDFRGKKPESFPFNIITAASSQLHAWNTVVPNLASRQQPSMNDCMQMPCSQVSTQAKEDAKIQKHLPEEMKSEDWADSLVPSVLSMI